MFTIPGLASHDVANDGRLSVNRAARRRNLSPGAWVADQDGNPCYQDCQDPGAPHLVKFRLWSKNTARTHIFRQTGGDPAKLKYNPWTSHKRIRHDDAGQVQGLQVVPLRDLHRAIPGAYLPEIRPRSLLPRKQAFIQITAVKPLPQVGFPVPQHIRKVPAIHFPAPLSAPCPHP